MSSRRRVSVVSRSVPLFCIRLLRLHSFAPGRGSIRRPSLRLTQPSRLVVPGDGEAPQRSQGLGLWTQGFYGFEREVNTLSGHFHGVA